MPAHAADLDLELADDIARFEFDPLGYVRYVFDWGHGDLKDEPGPDEWQVKLLNDIGAAMRDATAAVQMAIASGHGIGKTAISAWVIHWFIATRPGCAGVVTANTRDQLVNKTWRELAKWNSRAINGHWFDWSATAFRGREAPETWFIAAQPWTKERSEAFAGLHEKDVLVLYDEASAIEDIIWEVSEGAMTERGALWLALGNPTRNTGRFRECFGKLKHRWITKQIDSRTAKRANKDQIQQWIDDYGEDSDFVKVRVRGIFPQAGSMQLIPGDVVDAAQVRQVEALTNEPVVIGVDVARYGDDQSVIAIRQGRDARSRKWKRYRGVSTMQLASEVAMVAQMYRADAIFVDGTGIGAGVVDRLEQLKLPQGCTVYEINFGAAADATWVGDDARMANKSAEMWWNMANWLKRGGIPDDPEIRDDLIGREYGYTRDNAIMLEKKEDMKKRGLSSPDCFIAGTQVLTPSGPRAIETLRAGDEVVTPWAVRRIIAVHQTKAQELTTAKFSNGATLTGKGKHQVFTRDSGWVRMDALSLTNGIETDAPEDRAAWLAASLLNTGGRSSGFSLAVDISNLAGKPTPNACSIAASGAISTAPFLRAMTCITRTTTGGITTPTIWSLSKAACTSATTCLSDWLNRNSRPAILSIWTALNSLLANGMDPRKGFAGIPNMESERGSDAKQSGSSARSAARATKHSSLRGRIIAQAPAPSGSAIDDISTTSEPAQRAAQRSRPIDIEQRNTAPVSVQTETASATVFNLTLDEDNAYYANGILVRNCADALALTFAYAVAPRVAEMEEEERLSARRSRSRHGVTGY